MFLPRLKDLSETARTVLVTLACESVPLVSLTVATWALMDQRMVQNAEDSLGVALDSMRERIDVDNRANLRALQTLASQRVAREYCSGTAPERAEHQAGIRASMGTFAQVGRGVESLSVLSPAGVVWASTLPEEEGADMSARSFVATVLSGGASSADTVRQRAQLGGGLSVGYALPLEDERGTLLCVVVVLADTSDFDTILKDGEMFQRANGAVTLLDEHGVRMNDPLHPELVGRPSGVLPVNEVDAMVKEGRFRRATATLLGNPLADAELFELARADVVPDSPLWGESPLTGKRSLLLARRLTTARWTVAARIAETDVLGPARALLVREVSLGVGAIGVAIGIGLLLARLQQRRLLAMVAAADAIANGNLEARIPDPGKDEIGHVCTRFNQMAEALQRSQANLEAQVAERTEALGSANTELEAHERELREQRDELMAQHQELVRQKLELEHRNVEMETAGRQEAELISRVSHKLRAPLRAVTSYADLLLAAGAGALASQQRELIDAIAAAARRQLAIVTDLIDWSEMDAGRLDLSRAALSVEGALTTARGAIMAQADRRKIAVTATSTATRPVFADARRLHQVVLHLLTNAVKFSPGGTTVDLAASDDGAMIAFEVADRGPGVPEDMWPRLFQPFQQIDWPLTKGEEGTGLGLAVCRRLVEAQGGGIAVRSREGGGLVVRFTLPAAVETAEKSGEKGAA